GQRPLFGGTPLVAGGGIVNVISNPWTVHQAVLDAFQPIVIPTQILRNRVDEVALIPLAMIAGTDDELLRCAFASQAAVPGEGVIQDKVSPTGELKNRDSGD